MTDLNIVLSSAETGEQEDKFSVHRGSASSMTSLVGRVRDAIRSDMDLDSFVHTAQEGETWETISPFINRVVVPGGWIYKIEGSLAYVPNPEWKPKYDQSGSRIR